MPLLSSVVFGAAVFTFAVNSASPLDGDFTAPGVQKPVRITRNASDDSRIDVGSANDAWYALGWTHASERAWQLAFNRRVVRA